MIYHSDYKITGAEEHLQRLKYQENIIIIFGTGNYGSLALHSLNKHGIAIDYFCDNNKENWGNLFNGYKVISPDELRSSFPNAVVLIASLRFKYMRKQLRDIQSIQILDCDFLFTELDLLDIVASASRERLIWMLDLYLFAIDADKDVDRLRLNSLDVVVTEKCTLRCKDCANLMQYYKKPNNCDLGLLIDSLDCFMMSVDELYEARLIGGEPFVYKELPLVIEQLSAYENCKKITILTNGTIIPKDDMIESLRNDKVTLIISDYGKLSKKCSDLRDLMLKMDIPFIDFTMETWQDCATIYHRKREDNEITYIFGNCCVNDSLTLLKGKLYTCPFAAHAANLKAIPDTCDESVDLLNTKETLLKDKIRELYSGKEFIEACSFCAGRDYSVGKIKAAIQTKSPLEFKKY